MTTESRIEIDFDDGIDDLICVDFKELANTHGGAAAETFVFTDLSDGVTFTMTAKDVTGEDVYVVLDESGGDDKVGGIGVSHDPDGPNTDATDPDKNPFGDTYSPSDQGDVGIAENEVVILNFDQEVSLQQVTVGAANEWGSGSLHTGFTEGENARAYVKVDGVGYYFNVVDGPVDNPGDATVSFGDNGTVIFNPPLVGCEFVFCIATVDYTIDGFKAEPTGEPCDPVDPKATIDIEKFVAVTPAGDDNVLVDCDDLGKPQELTFRYNGGSELDTGQNNKASVEGLGDDGDGVAYFVVTNTDKIDKIAQGKADIYFQGEVDLGEEFTASLAFNGEKKFGSNTVILQFADEDAFLDGDGPVQISEYHTSCSQPITLGDIIGGIELTGYGGENGDVTLPGGTGDLVFFDADDPNGADVPEAQAGDLVTFEYVVTNPGDVALTDVEVTDDRLTDLTRLDDRVGNNDDILEVGEEWIYRATETATGEGLYTNIGTVVGTPIPPPDGPPLDDVTDWDPANYTVPDGPPPIQGDVCDVLGKPEALTFEYIGGSDLVTDQDKAELSGNGFGDDDNTAYFVVSDKHKVDDLFGSKAKIYFQGDVELGQEFTASIENAGTDKMKANTYIFQFDDEQSFLDGDGPLQVATYHTSCSQPINLGDILGGVRLDGYEGEDGATFA